MAPEQLMALHLKAMFTLGEGGSLLTCNEPWDKTRPAPLLFAAFPQGGRPICRGPAGCVALTPENLGQHDLGEFAWLREELPMASPCFARFAGGQAVSVCRSVRVHAAHEAGVETVPAWRGRGLAPVVVTAWANAVEELGRVPLYTASAENRPSLRLAEKCGFLPYGEAVAFHPL